MFEFSVETDDFLPCLDIKTTLTSSQNGSTTPTSSLSHSTHPADRSQTFGVGDGLEGLQIEIDPDLMQWPFSDEHPFPLQLDWNGASDSGTDTDLASAYNSMPVLGTLPNDPNAFPQTCPMAEEYSLIPYIEPPLADLSPSPNLLNACSSDPVSEICSGFPHTPQPKTPSKIRKARKSVTKHGLPIKGRCQYEVNVVYDFMWRNVAMSQNKMAQSGPGKHGVKILDHFGSLEAAKAHLAASKVARRLASRAGINSREARQQRDRRRDFFCFMPGCGLCFERADKLERHLIETNVHGTRKPVMCSHHGCNKSFVDIGAYFAHKEKHITAGDHDDDCFIPYPWHCPYPAVVAGLWRTLEALPTPLEDDSVEV